MTYPEVGEFLNTYVAGKTPIPYEVYFAKMGVTKEKVSVPVNPFLKDQATPYITVNPTTKEINFINDFIKYHNYENDLVIGDPSISFKAR